MKTTSPYQAYVILPSLGIYPPIIWHKTPSKKRAWPP